MLWILPITIISGQDVTWDVIAFEAPYEYLGIDTSGTCIWQIATPHKTFFDSSCSTDQAIITDSLNSYPVNNYSFFDLKIGAFNSKVSL